MKNSMKNLMRSIMLLLAVVFFSQCDTEDPTPELEEELITTMTLTFSPVGGGADVLFIIKDEDGPEGPLDPVYTNGVLAAGASYNVSIALLNEAESPVENITEEIEEEDDEHQFFFLISNGLNLDFAYDDVDANGNPVGLSSIFAAGEASTGTLTVELRHEPNKEAAGVSDGLTENAGGETDIQATFDVVIE
jgi:hypothetical protein